MSLSYKCAWFVSSLFNIHADTEAFSSIMHSKGVPQQEPSLCLSIWNKKIMIMNAGKTGELIIFMYTCSSAVPCNGNMIVSVQFSSIE